MSPEFLSEVTTYLYSQCHKNLITDWGVQTIDRSGQQIIQFPQDTKGIYLTQIIAKDDEYPTFLKLVWWAQFIQIKINHNIVQEGDLFDQKCRLLLPLSTNLVEIYLDTPFHDRGAIVTSILSLENDYYSVWQDIAVMSIYGDGICNAELEEIWLELKQWYETDRELLTLKNLQQKLQYTGKNLVKNKHIYLLGNAHIDIAWLWTISETKQVVERTCRSVVDLQTQFPELIFNQSSAVTYQWIEENNPQLFKQIQLAVQNDRWELTGGMWVEPDCNLPCGESLIRQIIYGKNYFREKFNVDVIVAWLPDSFGFNWQLPQILLKSGFRFFVTQKLSWNDTNKFPYTCFWWQGVDGSRIFTYFTNQIGADIDPLEIAKHLHKLELTETMSESVWLYGVGDHGGGPTADMLHLARQLSKNSLAPRIHHSKIESFLTKIVHNDRAFPVWQDELYLEFHRGTYTTKADQKYQNRRCELLLLNLEKLSSIDSILRHHPYPQNLLDRAWRLLLVNQFHDIITGTSIPAVFRDANNYYAEIARICREISGDLTSDSFYLWNLYSWETHQLVSIHLDKIPCNVPIAITVNGQPVYFEMVDRQIIFPVTMAPCSSSIVKFLDQESKAVFNLPYLSLKDNIDTLVIENEFLQVQIDRLTGEICQILDHRSGKALLREPIHWQFFRDRGQYWDAWNIDPNYEKYPLNNARLISLDIHHYGQLVIRIKTIHQFNHSTITSTIELDGYSPFVTVSNYINWQEEYTLAKIAFPVNFACGFATYEIPMATIDRPFPAHKWEVPAQFWANLSCEQTNQGLAVLNDSKYGYSARPDLLKLTALRSPQWTCPDSDRGDHYFSYRLVPHQGDWRSAQVVKLAQEFNNPLFITSKFLLATNSLISVSSPQIVFSSWTRLNTKQGWILRFYESWGIATNTEIKFAPELTIYRLQECNLMEEIMSACSEFQLINNSFTCSFQPYEIKTFLCVLTDTI